MRALILLTLFFVSASAAHAADAGAYIVKAGFLLRQAKYGEAFAAAREAIRIDANNSSGYYLAAKALYHQDLLNEAATYAQGAVYRATPENRQVTERLLEDIEKKRLFHAKVKAGDEAIIKQMFPEAAGAYTEAWRAFPLREEIGLKAASIWSEKTADVPEGAKIYRELLATSQEEQICKEARERLIDLKPLLRKAYRAKEAEAKLAVSQGRTDAAYSAFCAMMDAEPKTSAYADAADILAARRKPEEAMQMIRRGAREGGLTSGDVLSRKHLRALCSREKFVAFLADVFGPEAVADAKEICRVAADLTGVWMHRSVAGEDHRYPWLKVRQEGSHVIVEEMERDIFDAQTARVKFDGFRSGDRISGTISLFQDVKRCRGRNISAQIDTAGDISEDGTTIAIGSGIIKTGFGIFGIGCNNGIERDTEVWEKIGVKYQP